MARQPREDWPGAWHHVMNRGRNRDIIFRDDEDAAVFLYLAGETCLRYELEVHAYSLMPNHYHLLVRSIHGNLSDAMKHLGSVYGQRFHLRHGGDGGLFKDRFKSQAIKHEAYLVYVLAYIHLNPLKANLVTRLDSEYAWTSHRSYMGAEPGPDWLEKDTFLGFYDSPHELESLILRLHRKAEPWPEGMTKAGWFKWHLCPVDEKAVKYKLIQSEEVGVDDLLCRICEVCGASRERLSKSVRGPKGNPERRFAVWALRESTLMTYREIGDLLDMTPDHVAHNVRMRTKKDPVYDGWVEEWKEKVES